MKKFIHSRLASFCRLRIIPCQKISKLLWICSLLGKRGVHVVLVRIIGRSISHFLVGHKKIVPSQRPDNFFVHSLKFFVQSFLKIGKNIKKKIKMWLQKDFDHKPYSTITPDPNFSCALLGIVAKRRALCFDIAIFCPVSQSIVINIGVKRHCASISWATFAILSFS